MASVYDRDGFETRVNFAAAVISSGRQTTRNFDTCFEMSDGDYVVEALRRRAERNPKLAERFPKYIAQYAIDEQREKLGHLTRKQLADAARQAAWDARPVPA